MTPAQQAVIDAARAYADLEDAGTLDRINKALNELDADETRVIDAKDFVEKTVVLNARAGFLARRLLDPSTGNGYPYYATVRQLSTASLHDLQHVRNVGPMTVAALSLAMEQVGLHPAWTTYMPPLYATALSKMRETS